jgi:hypothetical protein
VPLIKLGIPAKWHISSGLENQWVSTTDAKRHRLQLSPRVFGGTSHSDLETSSASYAGKQRKFSPAIYQQRLRVTMEILVHSGTLWYKYLSRMPSVGIRISIF